MRATRFGALLLGFAIFAAAGCGSDAENSPTVSVGVLAPLDAGLTQFGRGIRNSVQLAVDEAAGANRLPGWKLEVIAVDDSSNPGIGRSNARRLLDTPSVIGALAGHRRVDDAVRADIIARVQAITNAALINQSGAVTGAIGFDAFGDTIHPVLTIYRVENGHWSPLD
jgi:substrate-binding family protein